MTQTVPLLVPLTVVSIAILIATITDLRTFKIHNLLTIPLLFSGLAYHGLMAGYDGLITSVMGGLFGFGVLVIFFLVGGVGGGDVKLLAGVGAWLGFLLTFWLFNLAALAAGVYAVILIVLNGRYRQTWMNLRLLFHRLMVFGRHLGQDDQIEEVVQKDNRRLQLIPFGAMLGVGLIAMILISLFR